MKKTDKEIIANQKGKLSEKSAQIDQLMKQNEWLRGRNRIMGEALDSVTGVRKYYKITYKAFNKDKTVYNAISRSGFGFDPMTLINDIRDNLYHYDSFELVSIEVINLNV